MTNTNDRGQLAVRLTSKSPYPRRAQCARTWPFVWNWIIFQPDSMKKIIFKTYRLQKDRDKERQKYRETEIQRDRNGIHSKKYFSHPFVCYCHFKDDLWLRSRREKFYFDILAQIFFQGQYKCGEARKKNWEDFHTGCGQEYKYSLSHLECQCIMHHKPSCTLSRLPLTMMRAQYRVDRSNW